jgi:hypothetical protein
MDFAMGMVRFGRGFAIVLLAIGLFPDIARAGFFDFLFPQFQAPAARPFGPRPGYRMFGAGPGLYRHSFRKHRFAAHRKMILADKTHHLAHWKGSLADKTNHVVHPYTPIDLMHDESLRHGDAVMTGAGIRIFVGDKGSHHYRADFRMLSEIKGLSKSKRNALADLDAPGSNPGANKGESGMVTGRSVTDTTIVTGETITDARGRSIRYVGPDFPYQAP